MILAIESGNSNDFSVAYTEVAADFDLKAARAKYKAEHGDHSLTAFVDWLVTAGLGKLVFSNICVDRTDVY